MRKAKRGKWYAAGWFALVLGAAIIAMAPVWRFGIGPLFIRLPADLENRSVYNGHIRAFADRETQKQYPPGREAVTRITIRNRDVAVPSQTTSKYLVMSEHVDITDADTGAPLTGLRGDTALVLDRRTCENVPGVVEGIDRRGYSVKLPMRTGKQSYPIWDDDLQNCITGRYAGRTTFDGDRHKDIEVYIFEISTGEEKMAGPPPGLPATISGKKLKELAGRELPFADQAEIEIDYYKKSDIVWYVEPVTGTVAYVPKNHYEYLVKNAPGASPAFIKLAEVEYKRDLAVARAEIDDSVKYIRLINMDMRGVPLAFLFLGVAVTCAGLFLLLGCRPRERG